MNSETFQKLIFEIRNHYFDEGYTDIISFLFASNFDPTLCPHDNWDIIGPLKEIEEFDPSNYFKDVGDIGYLVYKIYKVFYLEKFDIYIKMSGWVSSYSDIELSDIKQVYPIEKTITIYE